MSMESEPSQSHPLTGTHLHPSLDSLDSIGPDVRQDFNLEPLRDYNGAIDNDDHDLSEVPLDSLPVVEFPTLKPPGKIGNNSEIQARRLEALHKGSSAICKGFLVNGQKASRRLYSSVFVKELDLLTRTLTSLDRSFVKHTGGYGYRVGKDTAEFFKSWPEPTATSDRELSLGPTLISRHGRYSSGPAPKHHPSAATDIISSEIM
ncbi:hypothetical protein B0H17DRAFT_1142550 [Mycena rosella]|uniref:Uncharacterized protein n=1 Tax=Mycena rosella TaxID=1033263 RepID=A0AAD7CX53_MYCRO|nr:hypothetical protein B0H17DRAFT_1142550 [Mycena rosella]